MGLLGSLKALSKTMDVVGFFLETCKLSPINAAKFMVNHERVVYLSVSFNHCLSLSQREL